jgi:hypothetical protein
MTNRIERRLILPMLAVVLLCGAALGQTRSVKLRVAAGEVAGTDVPVHVEMRLPGEFIGMAPDGIAVSLHEWDTSSQPIPGQLMKGPDDQVELWWIVPNLRTDRESNWTATLSAGPALPPGVFSWKRQSDGVLDLLLGGGRVLRYMYAYDASTPERLFETYKPYYHVFDASGQHLLTNGPGGLYPHHRGIFIGWNKTKVGDQEYDFWHMKGVTQQHQRIVSQTAGPVLARSRALIHWVGPDEKPVIAEEREVTVFRQPAPTVLLLDFRTELKAIGAGVFLNGDPEHAGVHYRAHNDVAAGDETVKATYLFHEDGIDPHTDQDLPWAAMSYGLNGRRYSVQLMNHPDNPKPTLYSAYRDYGRFGAFFTKKLKAEEVLPLRYRILIVDGQMPPREDLAGRYSAFVAPPRVTVVRDNP